MPEEILLTASGLEKLKNNLEEAKITRKEVIERIRIAKDFGDLSENAEYEEAKKQQAFIEGRIQELQEMIRRSRVISSSNDKTKVEIGNIVKIDCEGEKSTYSIVGATESDPLEGKISSQSPIAKAILGGKVGDTVNIPIPDGQMVCKILEIN